MELFKEIKIQKLVYKRPIDTYLLIKQLKFIIWNKDNKKNPII